jgi:hypothetical protein
MAQIPCGAVGRCAHLRSQTRKNSGLIRSLGEHARVSCYDYCSNGIQVYVLVCPPASRVGVACLAPRREWNFGTRSSGRVLGVHTSGPPHQLSTVGGAQTPEDSGAHRSDSLETRPCGTRVLSKGCFATTQVGRSHPRIGWSEPPTKQCRVRAAPNRTHRNSARSTDSYATRGIRMVREVRFSRRPLRERVDSLIHAYG